MKPAAFEHARPATLAAAIALLSGEKEARVLAGGQSLGPMLNLRLAQPRLLVQVDRIAELTGVASDADTVTIGACTTHAAISDQRVPDIGENVLARAAESIAYRAVRNRGTIGGSLCHADPAADWLTVLTALDASVLLQGPDGPRCLRVCDFIQGAFRTALLPGEILLAIRVPRLQTGARWACEKACRKPGDFADAMAAVLLSGDTRRAVIGALGTKPMLLEGNDVSLDGATHALQTVDGLDRVQRHMQLTVMQRALGQSGIMHAIKLTVNGTCVTADVEPRTHLADFLREDQLLTGTHLGCEHGVCGACTLLIDGAPARSCIAFAVACDGANIRTIEGLQDDPVMVQLRAAFTKEHALQCGYCTPGMLVTARDIVQRLPDADEARIRLELAGNLCRCTGYAGIVRAIERVLAENLITSGKRIDSPASQPPYVGGGAAALPVLPIMPTRHPESPAPTPSGLDFTQTFPITAPLASVWSAIHDPQLIASCLPGARLVTIEGDRVSGEVRASLGPIETQFTGKGRFTYDDASHRAEIIGDGHDRRTGTRLSAHAAVTLNEIDVTTTAITVSIDYTLRGPLAQFARGAIVQEVAAGIAMTFAANLRARLTGTRPPEQQHQLSLGRLMLRAIWQRLRILFKVSR